MNTAKYKRALKSTKRLKSLFREKYPDVDLTRERLGSFREALEFVVASNENPGKSETIACVSLFYLYNTLFCPFLCYIHILLR